ncbi:MAG: ribulokinase [Pirellulales bacterium]
MSEAGLPRLALGLDFGTESVRALLVDFSGRQQAAMVARYRHGQLTQTLPTGERLPAEFALQHPSDWLQAAGQAVRRALKHANARPDEVVSIGVDFTSCTMLPARADGSPLCLVDGFQRNMWAWPKLWKHHGAVEQTARLNQLARETSQPWLDRYGGQVGLEWFWPKVLETLENAPEVYAATDVWLEAGDWFVWQLVGGTADALPRSTCQAGYKACWNAATGYPSSDFLGGLHPQLASAVTDKMPGRMLAPGQRAGDLTGKMAERLGLRAGTPVSAAVIDAHAGVPGAGVSGAGTLVMVLGTSSCHMLNSTTERLVPGVAGVVQDGILPGFYGYETGQAAVGDAFDWLRRLAGQKNFKALDEQAALISPGAEGLVAVDWLNGCRTPLMNGGLKGLASGLSLGHSAAHLYRALIEGTAYGVRWIVELLRDGGVEVNDLVATGGLPHHNPLLVQIYADVLQLPIVVHASQQGPALGAAILGVLAAGPGPTGFHSAADAIESMAGGGESGRLVEPQPDHRAAYDDTYRTYRHWCRQIELATR